MSEYVLEQARQGNGKAFRQLMEHWYEHIYRFGYHYSHSHDLAMEITQQTFIAVHKKLHQLRDNKRFVSWLYRIAANCSHRELRKQRHHNSRHLPLAGTDLPSIPPADIALQQTERSELLLRCLQQLSEEQRVVILLKEYEGRKFREIADILGVSENTVKSRLYYGLRHLRKILIKYNL